MEIDLKQRLIGAIVLTFVVAIFVPFLLSDVPVTHRQMPPKAEATHTQIERLPENSIPITEINEVIEQPVVEVPETVTEVSTIEEPVLDVESVSAPEPDVEQQVITEKDVKPLPKKDSNVSDNSQTAKPNELKKDSKAANDKNVLGLSRGWIVQIGSFASEENAKKLHTKLKANQFKSFIDTIKNNTTNKSVYRVRVGPSQADKAKAEDIKQQLKFLLQLDGIVIEYP